MLYMFIVDVYLTSTGDLIPAADKSHLTSAHSSQHWLQLSWQSVHRFGGDSPGTCY